MVSDCFIVQINEISEYIALQTMQCLVHFMFSVNITCDSSEQDLFDK